MRNKKARKSLFTWCIRTLAVSLVPTLLLVSCASSDSDSGDTTAPTVTSFTSDNTVVGTSEFTLTFSEAVNGVSGQATSGACTANVQLVNTDNTSACLPIDATSTDSIVWTLDPAGEMDSGSYTLTVVAEGIADKSGNALAAGPNPISFTVADALSTVLNELDNDLTNDGIGGTLIADIKAAARTAGEAAVLDNTNTYDPALNTLLVVIPEVFDAALDVINSSTAADEVKEIAVGLVLNSLMDNVNSTSSLSTARVDTITGFTELLQKISEKIGKKANSGVTGDSKIGMGTLMKAFVKSLSKTSAAADEISGLVLVIVTKTTEVVATRTDITTTSASSVLGGITSGVSEGTTSLSATITGIDTSAVDNATSAGMDAGIPAGSTLASVKDAAKPDIVVPSITISATSPTNSAVAVTVTYYDDRSADENVSVSISDGTNSYAVGKGETSWSQALAEGTYTLSATATDEAGNTGTSNSVSVVVDKTAPVITITSPTGGYANTSPTVTGTATDDSSGISKVYINGVEATVDASGNFSEAITLTSGQQTITVTGSDAAGNAATSDPVSVTVDSQNPTITVNSISGDNATHSSDGNAIVNLTYADNIGIYSVTWSNGTDEGSITASSGDNTTIALTKEGANTITFTVTDNASNTATTTGTIFVDTEAPTGSTTNVLELKNTNSTYGSNSVATDNLTIVLDNLTYAEDAGTGVTHYLLTDNVSETTTSITATDTRWFSANTITTDNLTATFSMNASENATINPGDTLTLTMFAKDGMNKIGQVQRDSIIFDNVSPDNTSALAVAGTADNGSGYFVFTNYTSSSTAVMDVPSFYGDNGSSLIGYVLNDNATAPTSLGGFDNSSEWTTISSSGNTALYLHAIDAAYNTNTETVNVFVDQDSPVFSGSVGFTASYGGSDNSTHVLVSGTSDGSVTLTFTATFTDGGGIAGYYVSETQAVTTQLSADNFSVNGLTYTLTDVSGYTTTQDKTFYIYAVDNIGQIAAAPAKTIKIVPEARAVNSTYASQDSLRALTGPAVDEFVLNGYTNGDNRTAVDNGSVINAASFDMRLSVSSDTTPVYGWKVTCENIANTSLTWTKKTNHTAFDATAITAMMAKDNESFNYDNFTTTVNLTDESLGCVTASGILEDGTKTVYAGVISQGGTVSTIVSDTITIDTTLPIIDNFTLKDLNADNSTHSTGAIIRSLLDFSDNNTTTSSLTDNGTGVVYYIVSENGTTPEFNDSRWLSVDNQTSHNDNFTIVTQSTNPGDTVTIYAWVKDNATNISARSTKTITIKADSSAPVINGFYINNASPAGDNATYINNKDNVSLYISAWDTDSGITDYYLSTDNGSPSESEWTAFAATNDNFTDNVSNLDLDNFPAVSLVDGNNTLYLWVRNSQDNVTKAGTTVGVDTFILDTTAPKDNDTPRLTGSVASVSNRDNQTYTTTLTVTLDNVSLWADDNTTTPANAVSGVYAYYLSDNGTTAPTVSSSWQTLDNLTLSLDNSSAWEGVNILNDNNSVGNKTIHVWYRDEAFNIASTAKSVSIFFDNETPDWSGVGYTLHDTDASSGNYTLDNLNTNSATITIDNVTAYDNESGHVGSGIWKYFFTDNQTKAEALRDNSSGWEDSYSSLTFDNKTNRLVTVYGYVKDRAGNISAADNTTISFDNATPVIDNLTIAGTVGLVFSGNPSESYLNTYAKSAVITLSLSANDNESTGAANYSSGWKDVKYVYSITRDGNTVVMPEVNTGWLSLDNLTTVTSDNLSFDNATFTLALIPDNTSANVFLDNRSGSGDNLTVTVWMRDNASNVSDNRTTVFSLDNSTIYYK